MRRASQWSLLLLLFVTPLNAAEPKGRVVEDIWHAAYLDGVKTGFVHTFIEEISRDGKPTLRTTSELRLLMKRFDNVVELGMETGTEEDKLGKVSVVFMRQYLGKQQQLEVVGNVQGNKLLCEINGPQKTTKTVPWNDQVVGLARQERLYQEHKVKPGDSFSYQSYEPTVVAVVKVQVTVKNEEDVEVMGTKQRLLRVEADTEKIQGAQLPTLVSWLDKDFRVVRSQVDMPGLGNMLLYRSTQRQALEKGQLAKSKDIGVSQLISLNRRILQPYETTSAVFRIQVKGDAQAATSFVQDQRQSVRNVKGDSFELIVNASRGPRPNENAPPAADEFLSSNYFINSSDARVKELSRQAVGSEKEAWKKALRIERWVHDHMVNKNFTEAFATADQVARTLEGDCTEHAMLAAAMCRAAGVPSRIACGLIYVTHPERGPVLGFHMWTEVYVHGQWLPIDATLGRGYVGATHLKITDHSWYDIQSLTPLLPVVRVLGKLGVEVLQVEGP